MRSRRAAQPVLRRRDATPIVRQRRRHVRHIAPAIDVLARHRSRRASATRPRLRAVVRRRSRVRARSTSSRRRVRDSAPLDRRALHAVPIRVVIDERRSRARRHAIARRRTRPVVRVRERLALPTRRARRRPVRSASAVRPRSAPRRARAVRGARHLLRLGRPDDRHAPSDAPVRFLPGPSFPRRIGRATPERRPRGGRGTTDRSIVADADADRDAVSRRDAARAAAASECEDRSVSARRNFCSTPFQVVE